MGLQVLELSADTALAVSLRAHGSPNGEWEPLFQAGQQVASLLGVRIPELPAATGDLSADRAAARTWLATTFPNAVNEDLGIESGSQPPGIIWATDYLLHLAQLHLRNEKAGADQAGSLDLARKFESVRVQRFVISGYGGEKLVQGFGSERVDGRAIREALQSGVPEPQFRRMMVGMLVRFGEMTVSQDPDIKGPLAFGLPPKVQESLDENEQRSAKLAGMARWTAPPRAADVDAAAKVADDFLKVCSAGRASDALAMVDASLLTGDAIARLTGAIAATNLETGVLKSDLLLRGRTLRRPAASWEPNAADSPASYPYIILPYLCDYEKGLQNVVLNLRQSGDGTWKVLGQNRVPLDRRLIVSELASCIGLGVSLRAHGAPVPDWEAMHQAGLRLAAELKVKVPPLPRLPGVVSADRAATHEWLSATFPKEVMPQLDKTMIEPARAGLIQSDFHLLYEPDGPDNGTLWELAAANLKTTEGIFLIAGALMARLPASDFGRLLVGFPRRGFTGAPNDPLSAELTRKFQESDNERQEKELFGGSVASAVAAAIADSRNAPGWNMRWGFMASTEPGKFRYASAAVRIAGESADIAFSGFDQNPERIIIIGSDAWVSRDDGKSWIRNPGSRNTAAFKAVLKVMFHQDQAKGTWKCISREVKKSDDGEHRDVLSCLVWQKEGPDGKEGAAPRYDLVRHPSRGWITDGFWTSADLELAGKEGPVVVAAEIRSQDDWSVKPMVRAWIRMDQKPEINPPAGSE